MRAGRGGFRNALIWALVLAAALVPIALAASSPYLAYRNAPYIIGGFSGIAGLAILFLQPLLVAGYLPGTLGPRGRRWHRWMGHAVIACVLLHVGGLFVTSPPDTLDALLLVAPTPFSVYGVIAFWAVIVTAILVALRARIGPALWRHLHNALALVIGLASSIHALQIEGAMEPVSKAALCVGVLAAGWIAVFDLRVRRPLVLRRRASVPPRS